MSHDNRVRISCAALCRIQDARGRYLLGLNSDRLAQGRRIYTPLGGALRYEADDLLARFDAVPEDSRNRDLRLFIPPERLPDFRLWFLSRTERETSAFRELREELVDEFDVLTALSQEDVQIDYLHTYQTSGETGRSASLGAMTQYFHDIFAVAFISTEIRAPIERIPITSGLRWFSEEQLSSGVTEDGALVDGRALLTETE